MKLFIGDISFDEVKLREEEEHHITKVLRMKTGEEIYVTDGKGTLIKGTLQITGKKADINIIEKFPPKQKNGKNIHIAIAPTKNIDRFEFFIEKSVELGVLEITPLLSINSERKILKEDKLQKQIESACKQSLQTLFPKINPMTPLKEFMEKNKETMYVAHCYKEFEKIPLTQVIESSQDNLLILIGPEGDFSKKEIEDLYSKNAIGLDLGGNRLRTETAGIFVVSSYYFSQMKNSK